MKKKHYKTKLIITCILMLIISVVLAACTTILSDDLSFKKSKFRIKYKKYDYVDMDKKFAKQLDDLLDQQELKEIDYENINQDKKSDFSYMINTKDKSYQLFRLEENGILFYLLYENMEIKDIKSYTFYSDEVGLLINNIEADIISSNDFTRYDDVIWDVLHKLINQKITLEGTFNHKRWNFDKDIDQYKLRTELDNNEYLVSITIRKNNLDRYLDYDIDTLIITDPYGVIQCADPTLEQYIKFITEQNISDINISSYDEIKKIEIFDVSEGDMMVLCSLINDKDIFNEFFKITNKSINYKDNVGTTHPKMAVISLDNGTKLKLWYGTQGYITVYDGKRLINIKNPELERFMDKILKDAADAYDNSVDNSNNKSTEYDINRGNGHIIEIIMSIIDGMKVISDLTEEFSMEYDGNAYRLTMFTTTDEYEIEFRDNGAKTDSLLDYSLSELNIKNNTDNWTLRNPNAKDINKMIYDEYLEQREAWRENNIKSLYTGNFIRVYTHKGSQEVDIIDEVANRITSELKKPDDTIIIRKYNGTDKEFQMKGIQVFLEDMNHKDAVSLWINIDGVKAMGYANKPIPVSEKAYDMIVSIAMETMGWQEGDISEINNLVSAELIFNNESMGIVSDKKDVKVIEDMLSNSIIMNGLGGCPFGAKLLMTRADGKIIEAILPIDSCGYIILGSSKAYLYNRDKATGESNDNKEILLSYFGLTDLHIID